MTGKYRVPHQEILGRIYDWINEGNYIVDIAELRRLYPALTSFETWLEKTGKAKFEAMFDAQRSNA